MNTKLAEKKQVWLVSANNLRLGDIVYRTAEHGWSRDLAQAHRFSDQSSANDSLVIAETESATVISAYVIPALQRENGQLSLSHYRNRFRDHGPTHRPDLARTQSKTTAHPTQET